VSFHVSLGHFVLVLFSFVVLGLVSSVLGQEIGWEDRFRNDLFCIEWDITPCSINRYEISSFLKIVLHDHFYCATVTKYVCATTHKHI